MDQASMCLERRHKLRRNQFLRLLSRKVKTKLLICNLEKWVNLNLSLQLLREVPKHNDANSFHTCFIALSLSLLITSVAVVWEAVWARKSLFKWSFLLEIEKFQMLPCISFKTLRISFELWISLAIPWGTFVYSLKYSSIHGGKHVDAVPCAWKWCRVGRAAVGTLPSTGNKGESIPWEVPETCLWGWGNVSYCPLDNTTIHESHPGSSVVLAVSLVVLSNTRDS